MPCAEHWNRISKDRKDRNRSGRLVYRCGIMGCGKNSMRQNRDDVTLAILDELGVDEKPDIHGNYKTTPATVYSLKI